MTPRRLSTHRRKYLAALARTAGGRQDARTLGDGYGSDDCETPKQRELSQLRCLRMVSIALESHKVCTVPTATPPFVLGGSVSSGWPRGSPGIHGEAAAPVTPPQVPGIRSPSIPGEGGSSVAAPQWFGGSVSTCSPIRAPSMHGEAARAAAFESLQLHSPGKRILEKQEETLSEPLLVSSPSKRLRSKVYAPLVVKRSQKYCQKESCVFSRNLLGQLAMKVVGVDFCVWCDSDLLASALQDAETEMNVKVSLACFKKKDPEVYRLALEKLDGYEVHSQDFCAGIGCVYSNVKPGVRARCQYAHDFCQWCDADGLVEAKGSIEGRKRLNQALSVFRTHPAVYEAALAKLGKDFVRASRYCGSTGCIFSYRNPGERSRARPQSDLCFWCNPAAVSAAEMTPSGGSAEVQCGSD